ncbi:cofactor-independent phosphoglycerate mutase [bacterium]|nr:cofactor-independent phosphoglycerate mutase [bacterium]RQV99155.1 MAG: cofactor-independent phosphoglycerate mutase [bacterium]
MKHIIVLGDGMSDYPIPELNHKTPLMVANKPAMDYIAQRGRTGSLQTIPPDMPTGSAVANLTVLGYDPHQTFQGRGVLEAASLGIELSPRDMAMRVNLISVEDNRILSHSADHITNEEASQLIQFLQMHFKTMKIRLYPGLSYRHVLIMPGGDASLKCAPPHDHLNQLVEALLIEPLTPKARETADRLNRLIHESHRILQSHPLNIKRKKAGKLPANMLWPWSPGRKPEMETFQKRFGIKGAAISAVDLIKGLAIYAGMDIIPVEGATGLYDTNYENKADAALDALNDHDLVFVHVEAPDEAGHAKNVELKIKCIEDLDRRLLRRILDGLTNQMKETVLAVLPDHPTPIVHGAHTREPVPVAIMDPRIDPDPVDCFNEESVKSGSLGLMKGSQFIEKVLGEK